MRRFDEHSEFVRSVVQVLVALVATLVGAALAAGYIWVNVWLRPLAFARNIAPLELFALGCEA